MEPPQPLISISTGVARYLREPPHFEPGHNYTNEVGNLSASNDWDAMLEFINEYRQSEKTFRSYATEIERLCLWLTEVKSIPLSGLKRTDLAGDDGYYKFVENPPRAWCGPSAKKFSKNGSVNPKWRPFKQNAEGKSGLSPGSVRRVQKILQSLFTYLVDEGYLLGNPAIARRTKGQRSAKGKKTVERFLQPHEAIFVEGVLQDSMLDALNNGSKPEYFKALRRHYLFELFLHTGMRISEPVKYTMGDIEVAGRGDNKIYSLEISGKGNLDEEARTVTLGKPFIDILKIYRSALNDAVQNEKWKQIDPLPSFREPVPLVPDISGYQSIGERQISSIFVEIRNVVTGAIDSMLTNFQGTEEELSDYKRTRSVMSNFTCHWMRHTHATYFLALTGDLKSTQERLGHADISTTQIYVHVLEKNRNKVANKYNPADMLNIL